MPGKISKSRARARARNSKLNRKVGYDRWNMAKYAPVTGDLFEDVPMLVRDIVRVNHPPSKQRRVARLVRYVKVMFF